MKAIPVATRAVKKTNSLRCSAIQGAAQTVETGLFIGLAGVAGDGGDGQHGDDHAVYQELERNECVETALFGGLAGLDINRPTGRWLSH